MKPHNKCEGDESHLVEDLFWMGNGWKWFKYDPKKERFDDDKKRIVPIKKEEKMETEKNETVKDLEEEQRRNNSFYDFLRKLELKDLKIQKEFYEGKGAKFKVAIIQDEINAILNDKTRPSCNMYGVADTKPSIKSTTKKECGEKKKEFCTKEEKHKIEVCLERFGCLLSFLRSELYGGCASNNMHFAEFIERYTWMAADKLRNTISSTKVTFFLSDLSDHVWEVEVGINEAARVMQKLPFHEKDNYDSIRIEFVETGISAKVMKLRRWIEEEIYGVRRTGETYTEGKPILRPDSSGGVTYAQAPQVQAETPAYAS